MRSKQPKRLQKLRRAPPPPLAPCRGRSWQGKIGRRILPELEDDPEAAGVDLESLSQDKLVEEYGHLTGAGDIVWPAA